MKTTKKLLAILLTVFLLATMLPTVMAEGYTITIDFSYTPEEDHTFQAYQIFSGTLSSDGEKLSDVKWGSGVDGDAIITALSGTSVYADAQAVADALSTDADGDGANDLDVSTFKAAVVAHLGTAAATGVKGTDGEGNTVYTISGLSAGYYFVQESASMEGKNDAVTAYMLQVVKSVEVTSKTGVPSMNKHVKDNNDTSGVLSDWQDSADYDVDDYIPYRLEASLNISSGNYAEYSTYSMKFTDTMCDGLTLVQNDSEHPIKVVLVHGGEETEITNANGVTITGAEHKLVVNIADIKNQSIGAAYNDLIRVYYYCQLNSNAVIGSEGNPNTAYLEFSNNPNAEGLGKTPEDKNIVFTYQVTVNKVDNEDKPLGGAGFTLYKKVNGSYVAIGSEQGGKGSTDTTFSWLRLDEGDYKLEETTVPDGYTKADDVEFTITATHTNDSDSSPLQLTVLNGGDTFTGVVKTGTLSAEIKNQPGNTLPSTGGVGTTMFYVVGSVLAIGAFILLVAKKRASRAN